MVNSARGEFGMGINAPTRVGWFVLMAIAAPVTASETAPQPALPPGEVLMETANGCYVIAETKVAATRRALHPGFGVEAWSGACPSGLASGQGEFGNSSRYLYEMKNGRYLNTMPIRYTSVE